MKRSLYSIYLFAFIFVFTQNTMNAQTIYVDNQLTSDCTGNYSIADRNCSGSDGDAYNTLAEAAGSAVAGNTVLIRGGVFTDQLSPQNSGTVGNYITFKNYGSEVVEITGASLSPAIWIFEKNYIAIEGLQIRNVRRWLNALGSDYLIIKDNVFEGALDTGGSSKTGLFLQSCNYTKIQNNTLHDTTQDNLGMIDCDYNLIEGNTMTKGVHALWAFKCSNYNIIRNNYFHNELQKIGEIYDCDNAGFGSTEYPKLNSLDDTKYNVVENNVFAFVPSSGDSSPYSGIQFAGQYCIIRNNIFYECVGPAIQFALYGGEANNNYGNRMSHNVFYDNELGAIQIAGLNSGAEFFDQKIKNNILYKNKFTQNDFRWSWYAELNNQPVQILTGRDQQVLFDNNNIFFSGVDQLYVIAFGNRPSTSNPPPETLSWWETNKSSFIQNSLQEDPMFIDLNSSQYDFHLQENSPMIDAGAFLANTTNAESNSSVMKVDDARWFMDGFDIVSGDAIQLEGESERAIITSVNYGAKELTLDRQLTWSSGQGVSLSYSGTKPDLGAFEFESALSINDEVFDATISIFPNPTNDTLTIDLKNSDLKEVIIYNELGQQIKEVTTSEVNVSNLATGIYFFKIISQNGKIATKKIIKI